LHENYRNWHRNHRLELDQPDIPDRIMDLERAMISEEVKSHVRAILSQMKKRDRQLLAAIFLEEKDKDEVCQEFGVNREYLRVLLHRAKERFRSSFGEERAGKTE